MELKGNGFSLRTWKQGDEISLQKNADNVKIFNCLTDAFPSPYTMSHAISWVEMMMNQSPVLIFVIDATGKHLLSATG
jgi:[ribosomal protein S5]-alanine N-acetyltransferase